MKVDMLNKFRSLKEIMNRLMETARKYKVGSVTTGGGNAKQTLRCSARSHHVIQKVRVDMATSPPKSRQKKTLRTRCRKPGKCCGSKSPRLRPGVSFTQPRKQGILPRYPSSRRRFRVSCHMISTCNEEVFSLTDKIGANRKQPFDCGKVMLMRKRGLVLNLEDKVLWRIGVLIGYNK